MSGCSARSSSTWAGRSTAASTSPAIRPPTPTASAATCSSSCASWASASSAIRAGTSSPPTTGRTASGRSGRTRLDLAWHSIEPNTFGTDEFMRLGGRAGIQPLLAVNLGTRGIDAARALLEYVNAPRGTKWADTAHRATSLRRQALVPGQRDGRAVAGRAEDRGRVRAAGGRDGQGDEAGSTRRSSCASCGSSNSSMPTFGAWEDTVLDLTWEIADYVSLHTYYDPAKFETSTSYLRCSQDLDRMIDTVVATADAVAGRKRSRKRIGDQRRRVERVASDRQPAPRRPRRAVQARAGAGRGRAHGRRRARRRLPADHAAAPRRPGQDRLPRAARERDPADPDARTAAPRGGRRPFTRSRTPPASATGRCCASSSPATSGGDRGARRGRRDGLRGQSDPPTRCRSTSSCATST